MSLTDALSKIFKVDLSSLKTILIKLINVNVKKTYIDNRIQILNIGELSEKKKKLLQQTLRESVSKQGVYLLDSKADQTVDDIHRVEKEGKGKEILEFFKDKIPPLDLEALRASIYLKEVADRGEPIDHLKHDIISRFGERGNNISNLYSSGYFQSQILPLYEQMSQRPDFNQKDFVEAYNIIVTESPYAVFINARMTDRVAKQEVVNRLAVSRKYGIKRLNIHGIGNENVRKIMSLLPKLEKDGVIQSYDIKFGGDKYVNARVIISE